MCRTETRLAPTTTFLRFQAPRPGAGGFGRHRAGTDHATAPPRDGPTEPSASLIRPSLGVESNGFLRVTCSCSEEPGPASQRGFWRTRGCGLGCPLPEIKPPSASLYDLFRVFLLPPAPAPRPKTTHVTPEVTPRGGSISLRVQNSVELSRGGCRDLEDGPNRRTEARGKL